MGQHVRHEPRLERVPAMADMKGITQETRFYLVPHNRAGSITGFENLAGDGAANGTCRTSAVAVSRASISLARALDESEKAPFTRR